jgi:hypothetical protein
MISGFRKSRPPQAPKPLPKISEPIPGSAKRIPDARGAVPPNPAPAPRPALPRNEYPHNRPVPNNVLLRKDDGRLELFHLPPGSVVVREGEAMSHARPPSDRVDIGTAGWPANNHTTNKWVSLKEAHSQAYLKLETARLHQPSLTADEKKNLAPAELKARKKEIAHQAKDKKAELHGLEKDERQAKRNLDVFKGRFSRELRTEADFRASRPGPSRERQPSPELQGPVVPTSYREAPAPFGKSKAPTLDSIPERPDSSLDIRKFPPGIRPADGVMTDSSVSKMGPHERQLNGLRGEYRDAKNAYHGMKAESATYSPETMSTARARYKSADAALTGYMKEHRGLVEMERRGELANLDDLRAALRPGQGGDRFPAFSGAQPGMGMDSLIHPDLPPMQHPAADPIFRPSAPGPDHPRNRGVDLDA